MEDYELLTIEEVAKMLRVSERTVYEWAQKGEIPAGKFGSAWRFKRADISKWIDSRLKSPKRPFMTAPLDLGAVLEPGRVVFLDSRTKEDALTVLVDVLAQAPQVHDRDELLGQVFRREELMSTGIGLGVAVPHVRLNSVDDLVMAVGVCREPLTDYESLDGEPVRIICMIAAKTDQHAKHIKALSAVSKRLKDEKVRKAILDAESPADVYALLMGTETE